VARDALPDSPGQPPIRHRPDDDKSAAQGSGRPVFGDRSELFCRCTPVESARGTPRIQGAPAKIASRPED